jgi:transcriptional regulator with PAS, ATPase and Fis domain
MRDLTELNDLRRKLEEAVAEKSLYFDELKRMKDRNGGKDIVCFSSGMKNVMQVAEKVAQFDTTILITGDSGSGKEVLARYIHNKSSRKNEPFIKVNCGAIPENLLESELFGYDGGAFTGAVKSGKKGLLDEADNGSFLLDEISELPLNLQVKLLRLLQEREFYRVGGNAPIRLNIRFIATSNKNLYALVKENKFRADLYYRLNVVQIQIPPLTERREEIPALVKLFLNKLNSKYHQNKQITNYAIDLLSSYDWPGNIRELENTIERLAITCPDDLITHTHLLPSKVEGISLDPVAEHNLPGNKGGLKRALDQLEKGMILRAYEQTGCTRKAGILLGINQSTVVKKMKKHELSINYKRNSS